MSKSIEMIDVNKDPIDVKGIKIAHVTLQQPAYQIRHIWRPNG
jgi:hypothetical protein